MPNRMHNIWVGLNQLKCALCLFVLREKNYFLTPNISCFLFGSLYMVAMTTTFIVMLDRGYNFLCWTSGYCLCDCVRLLFDSFVCSSLVKMQGVCGERLLFFS